MSQQNICPTIELCHPFKFSFPMKRYLGALAPGLEKGPGAGPQDCRGEESLTWRWLHSAQLCCCCCQAPTPTPGAKTAPLQLFLQAHHCLVVLFLPLNWSHATIIGCGSRHRSQSNRVMQLKREGPFNPSYVVPMPKSR